MYVNNFRSVNSNNENIMQHEQTKNIKEIFFYFDFTLNFESSVEENEASNI